jgi:hypothetical protein
VYKYTKEKKKKKKNMGILYEKPDLHSATGCCSIAL